MKKRSLLFSVLMLSSLSLASCNNQPSEKPVVETISLSEIIVIPPIKLEYHLNDELDLNGMVVKAVFSDGTVQAINRSSYQVSGFSSEKLGKKTITVSYTKDKVTKSDTFEVEVIKEEQIPVVLNELIVIPPTKLKYHLNDELDLNGMVVKAVLSDGSTIEVDSDKYQVSGFSSAAPGQCTITVSYTKDEVTKSDTFEVEILEDEYRPISLHQSDSRVYLVSTDEKAAFPIMTYHHKDFGDAPFLEMGQLMVPFFSFAEYTRKFEQVSENVYKFSRPSGDKNGYILFDADKQEITIVNAAGIYVDLFGNNNGFGDYGAGAKLVRGSSKTKMLKEGTPRVINLKQYGYRIESQDGRLYVPASLLGGLLFAPATSGLTYNGHDYFVRQSLENIDVSPLAYSSSRGFALVSAGGTVKQSYKPVAVKSDSEAYRYLGKNNIGSKQTDIDFVLNKDGTGKIESTEDSIMKQVEYDVKWSEDGDIITMVIVKLMMGDPIGTPRTIRIRKDDSSYYGLKTRSESLALDNYRGLCFDLDLNFGLKEFKGITSFDEYFTLKGRKEALLSTDPETYQDAVARFIYTDFDEMHSAGSDQSYYGNFDDGVYFSAKANDSEGHEGYMGSRNRDFISSIQRLAGLYDKAENQRESYEVYNETAILKFDSFYYKEPLKYNDDSYKTETYEAAQTTYFSGWSKQNTYKSFAVAFNDIAKNTNIKNIVFDVSLNTGGEVRVMPLLAAFYNKDPNIIVKNNIDGSIIDLHYEADLDGDGEYATETDSFEGKYNFYFMTGAVSFSCGNAFPTMAKNSKKAKIIGEISGGGSCMVDAFVTLDGLTFNTSSAYQFMLDNGDGSYVYNENGVPLDYPYTLDDAYNKQKLNTFLNGLIN